MRGLIVLSAVLFLIGCSTTRDVPVPRYHVTDLSTGKVYTAIAPAINKTAGGVSLREEDTGEHVTISNYSEQRLEDGIYKAEQDPWTGTLKLVQRVR